MNTELLKSKILDLLIKGELTSKWREAHKDIESADVLLEKIRIERENKLNDELIAKGKKPNAKVKINEVSKNDEPFEIPTSWKWVHLADIVDVKGGKRIPAGRKLTDDNTGYKYIRVTDMKNGSVNLDSIKYVPLDIVPIIKNYCISKDDIYITCAGTIGEVGLIPNELDNANLTENADKLILYINDKQWLYLFLSTALIKAQITKAITTLAQPKLAIQRIQEFVLPLPPLEEQKEIARIAERLFSMIDEVDGSYTNLGELSTKAKAKVLDLLIKGELTSKWRNEHNDIETADILLENIRSEKEKKLNDELLAKGKKPNAKVEIKPILKNDEPFEIPNSWKWCRLGDLAEIITDGTHKTPKYVNEGIPFLSIQNISKGYFDFRKIKYITKKEHEELIKRVKPQKGDILFCRIGTLGKAIEVNLDFEFSIFVSLGYIKLIKSDLNKLIIDLINSPYGVKWFNENKVGDGTHAAKLNLGDMPKFLIPLPPLEEQKEIARIAESLINQIDSLTNIDSIPMGEEKDE